MSAANNAASPSASLKYFINAVIHVRNSRPILTRLIALIVTMAYCKIAFINLNITKDSPMEMVLLIPGISLWGTI